MGHGMAWGRKVLICNLWKGSAPAAKRKKAFLPGGIGENVRAACARLVFTTDAPSRYARFMTHALHPNGEPLPGYLCVRRVGRSWGSESWLVQSSDKVERILKVLFDAGDFPALPKLTACRHP